MGSKQPAWFYDRCYSVNPEYRKAPMDAPWYPLWARLVAEVQARGVSSVVDIGCGPGHLAELLHEAGLPSYWGLDFSEEALRQARARNLPGGYRWLLCDIVVGGPYLTDGAVIACEVLEHVEEDLKVVRSLPPRYAPARHAPGDG